MGSSQDHGALEITPIRYQETEEKSARLYGRRANGDVVRFEEIEQAGVYRVRVLGQLERWAERGQIEGHLLVYAAHLVRDYNLAHASPRYSVSGLMKVDGGAPIDPIILGRSVSEAKGRLEGAAKRLGVRLTNILVKFLCQGVPVYKLGMNKNRAKRKIIEALGLLDKVYS